MIKTDCTHFPLDRPCSFHKAKGTRCDGCSRYLPVPASRSAHKKILIIKLDAMGDVLRTTFLLPGLKEKYPGCRITWIVAPESVQVLEGNPSIERIWPFDKSVFTKLCAERFDEVVNLDLSPVSLSLATMALAKKRTGFRLDAGRRVRSSNETAKRWLSMSAFDDEKRENTKTYQYWMARIAGLPRPDYPIFVPLRKESLARARAFAKKHKLNGRYIVGINPGAGGRWKLKKWTDAGYLHIIRRLAAHGTKVLLLGGPQEEALIKRLVKRSGGRAVSTGTNNSIPDFFALVNLCDAVITGDTMALHAALGLGKKVLALFGPTSSAEIEMYGQGEKIVSPASCTCCYIPDCTKKPTCMDMIKTDHVWSSVQRMLNS